MFMKIDRPVRSIVWPFRPGRAHPARGLRDRIAFLRSRRALGTLDAARLADIGIDAGVARREAAKPFWRR